MSLERMKTKKFLVLVILGVIVSIFMWLINTQNSSEFAHTIVSETSKKITDLKKLNEEVSELSHVDDKYLEQLGFVQSPRLYPQSVPTNVSSPVIVTVVTSQHMSEVDGFVRSASRFMPKKNIIIYGLELSNGDSKEVQMTCNCSYYEFEFKNPLPSFATDTGSHAYRPLVIQKALDTFQAIIFLDITVRIINSQTTNLVSMVLKSGVVAWAVEEPTSALTHPKMFHYFGVEQSKYFFRHLVDSTNMLIYNTKDVHYKVMLPWAQCALTENCLSPIGSQGSGCIRNRKPMYKYSGCHSYDKSAFSIILGKLFGAKERLYTASPLDKFFAEVDPLGPKLDTNFGNFSKAAMT